MTKTEDKTLAVGERFNQKRWTPSVSHTDSFKLRLQMGFYNKGSRRAFLNSLSVVWDEGINLLHPSPIPGEWNAVEARRVAEILRPEIEKYGTVLLFGARVCRAFDVSFDVLKRRGVYLPLPHPSGRCRMWNDCEFLNEVRRYFRNA